MALPPSDIYNHSTVIVLSSVAIGVNSVPLAPTTIHHHWLRLRAFAEIHLFIVPICQRTLSSSPQRLKPVVTTNLTGGKKFIYLLRYKPAVSLDDLYDHIRYHIFGYLVFGCGDNACISHFDNKDITVGTLSQLVPLFPWMRY